MRLHEQVKHYKALHQTTINGLNEIVSYLNSPKFSVDINVNKNDILMRLNELDNELFLLEVRK